ncbi:porin family protein [Vibrio pectenicida]|uniref:Porin family protein n=1 Tax=Vibrio pectenicida TaxID=62763 RepID=A0A427TU30_9VIBR|nr:outer membrane beta-barrel protein [Vibrio pectenicida]NOH73234.1 porin family protein [Vibrio pectenicida]RSD27907.1 porin family protein [Vibrio pectenicida]
MKKILILSTIMWSSASYAATHQIGIGIGGADVSGPNNWSDSGFVGKIDYAYQFHSNFAVEVGYAAAEGMTDTVFSALLASNRQAVDYSTGYTGLKVNISPLSFLNFYAVGGANYSSVKQSYTPIGSASEKTDTHTGLHPYYGVGTEVVILNTLGLGVEYRKFILANDFESDAVFAEINIKF